MVAHGEAPNIAAAARILARRNPGHNEAATEARLRRKAREMPNMRIVVEGYIELCKIPELHAEPWGQILQLAEIGADWAEREADIKARFMAYVKSAGKTNGAALAMRLHDSACSESVAGSPDRVNKTGELNS
jgi:hypothetical protein